MKLENKKTGEIANDDWMEDEKIASDFEIWRALCKPYINELYDSPCINHPANEVLLFLDKVKPKQPTKGWFRLVDKSIKKMAQIQELLENRKAPFMDKKDLQFAVNSLKEIKSLLVRSQKEI